jgi:BarA-like signal transduction histidine kinase
MIGAIAHTIFIAYAAPNSKTLAFAQHLIAVGKSVVTFDSSINPLQVQGIVGLGIDAIVRHCLDAQTLQLKEALSIDDEIVFIKSVLLDLAMKRFLEVLMLCSKFSEIIVLFSNARKRTDYLRTVTI